MQRRSSPISEDHFLSTAFSPATVLSSSQEWKDVLEEILPRQGEWSDEQYLILTDHRNGLVEFTDGFLEVLPMPTDRHQSILQCLVLIFVAFLQPRGGKVQFSPLRLRIRPGKFREPDLLLLLSAADPRRQNRFWTGADLALEIVSPDKPERDLVQKRTDYAEAQVQEYWIVNPQTETITVLRLADGVYVESGYFQRGESAVSALVAGLAIDVAAVFSTD